MEQIKLKQASTKKINWREKRCQQMVFHLLAQIKDAGVSLYDGENYHQRLP